MQVVTCFLLSYVKYGDNGAVLHCFSENHGFQSFFAKGIYSAKNKKKAYLFPLNKIQITIAPKRNSSGVENISKIDMAGIDYGFDNVKINTVLLFVADFLNQILREEHHRNTIYAEIEHFLDQLHSGNYNAHVIFLFRILACQGLSPLPGSGAFLDPEAGNFTAFQAHSSFDLDVSGVWKDLAEAEEVYGLVMKRSMRKTFLDTLIIYYKMHLPGFSEPHSLSVIQQVFE